MGPRPCGRGRTLKPLKARSILKPLQWGHGLAAVDGPSSRGQRRVRCRFNGATALRPWTEWYEATLTDSTKQLQWGHGLAAVDGRHVPRHRHLLNGLQWGHGLAAVDGGGMCRPCQTSTTGFNGATALRPWTVAIGADTCFSRSGFNGATALRPWTASAAPSRIRTTWASMGPRPCGRGRTCAGHAPPITASCFNGATALRPWTATGG